MWENISIQSNVIYQTNIKKCGKYIFIFDFKFISIFRKQNAERISQSFCQHHFSINANDRNCEQNS